MPRIIDLTHPISNKIPTWDLSCGFHLTTTCDYLEPQSQPSFKVQSMNTPCGVGTHIDAPAHCYAKGKTVEQLPMDTLIVPAIVIDISARSNSDNALTRDDIERFEATHGPIQHGASILIYTGWSQHWNTPEKYHNNYQFPYVEEVAARYLVEKGIHSLGIDTLSPDGQNMDFPVHKHLLPKEIIIIENLNANLKYLPATGVTLTIAPMKIENGTEAPARVWVTLEN